VIKNSFARKRRKKRLLHLFHSISPTKVIAKILTQKQFPLHFRYREISQGTINPSSKESIINIIYTNISVNVVEVFLYG